MSENLHKKPVLGNPIYRNRNVQPRLRPEPPQHRPPQPQPTQQPQPQQQQQPQQQRKPRDPNEPRQKLLWGIPIWIFFHTLLQKIDDHKFSVLGEQIFNFIKKICVLLPCPVCSVPTTKYLNSIDFNTTIKSAHDLRILMWDYHNTVNKKTGEPDFPQENLSVYSNNNILETYRKFKESFEPKTYITIPYNERHDKLKNLFNELDPFMNLYFS